ncbi:MAG: lipoate--protein ligase family protein [Anaerolineales bacterium]
MISPPARGAWNMAVDEAILEAAGRGEVPPTLRLYAWEPPCLSLGYAQPFEDVDLDGLRSNGWEVVRRPTGGRAILHTDELTYAICGPHDVPLLQGSVLESYHRISVALLNALHLLGAPAESAPAPQVAPGSDPKGPVCFEVPSSYEITASGKKLIGSAQARKQIGVLQHGSLPLYGDLTRITRALSFPNEASRQRAAERLMRRATTLEGVLGRRITWPEAAQAFMNAFGEVLSLKMGDLTAGERARAEEILAEKYAHPAWTTRVLVTRS